MIPIFIYKLYPFSPQIAFYIFNNIIYKICSQYNKMEYFPVYKVCYLKKDGVHRTYQFSGKSTDNDSKDNDLNVKVVKQQIYLDDTILDIKLKVMEELKLDDIFVTVNEMYMFNQAQVMLNADIVYEVIKKKGCLKCFLDNLTQVNTNEPFQYELPSEEKEEEYDLDDIISLNLNGPFLVDRVLGHKELTDSATQLVCNPFKFTKKLPEDDAETVNNSLGGGFQDDSLNRYRLLDCGEIENNVLFVCLAEDVMSSGNSMGELYFPRLNVNNKKRESHHLNVSNQSKVKLLSDIKKYSQNNLNYVSPWGIKLIHLTITQPVEQSIPLDLIFKNIHSDNTTPIIKYIPSDQKESIFRLYCNNKTEDGTLLPQLDLTEINTYINELTTSQKKITFLFQQNGLDLICTLNKRGDLHLTCDFQNSIKPLSDVQEMISNAVNFVTTSTSSLITDGGFKIAVFNTLLDESVIIERLLYSCEVKRETNVNNASIMRYLSCFKSIFTDEENSVGPEETHLVYKRVSPHAHGIKTNIIWMNSSKHVEVNIHDVINIRYLQTIPLYIESILLVVFNQLSAEKYPTLSDLNKVCEETIPSTPKSYGGEGDTQIDSEEEEEEEDIDNNTQIDSEEKDIDNNTQVDSDSESESESENSTQKYSENDTEKELIPSPYESEGEDALDHQTEVEEAYDEEEEEDNRSNSEIESDSDLLEEDKKKYIEHKIFNMDPMLISEKTSEICSSNKPVVVTDNQLEVIQKNYTVNKKDVLRYGSPASKTKNNYLCPMYWCPKLNIPISADEIQTETVNGIKQLYHPKCGKVIERTTTPINRKTDGIIEMRENYKRQPILSNCSDGFCVPCCAKKDSIDQVEDKEELPSDTIVDENTKLSRSQFGYLPTEILSLFGVAKYDRKSKELSSLNPHKSYFLRAGVEQSSFLGCVCRALSQEGADTITIQQLKAKIIEAIDIDRFIRYQNGNLVSDFQDSMEDINKHDAQLSNKMELYKSSTIYKKLNMSDVAERLYFKQVVSALLNFTRYLKDDSASIDFTYLWDILCVPNNKLFKKGINLIILVSSPTKNTIQLMCPTNHYSSEFYDPIKETLFLLRVDKEEEERNGEYNPICIYKEGNDENRQHSKARFLLSEVKDPMITPILKNLIKPHISRCRAHESLPEKTHMAPLFLSTLITEMEKYDYQITQQVLNYNNKVIGILVQSVQGTRGFVPCFPSGLRFDTTIDFVFVSHKSVWSTYTETVHFLTTISNISGRRIPCRPKFRVIQMSKIVVGILTESNQFVQLSSSLNLEEATAGNLKDMFTDSEYVEITDDHMGSIEKTLFTSDTQDAERENYISRIKSEDNFYITFKNTVRILLNNYENQKLKKELHAILSDGGLIYQDKLVKIEKMIRQMVGKKVQFTGNDSYYKLIKTVSACIGKDNEECSSNLCGFTDGNCNLIVPKNNLISPQKKNENIYFKRLTDELIRNDHVRAYLFRRQTTEGLGSLTYMINENEVILTESTIHSYMTNLKSIEPNRPANFNSFDEAIPSKSISYSNTVNLNDDPTKKCERVSKSTISGDKWNTYFPPDYHEITYGKAVNCSFDFATYIIKKTTNVKLNKNEIKIQLIEEYAKYTDEYEDKIRSILKLEGKPLAMNTNLSIWTIIQEATYVLTALDLWLLLLRHQIPFVFLSHSRIIETMKKSKILSGFAMKDNDCVFIILPSYSSSPHFSFKVIQNEEDSITISLKDFKNFNTKTKADLSPIPMNEFVMEILSKATQRSSSHKNAMEECLETFDMNQVVNVIEKNKTRKNKFFKRGTKKREL